MIFRRGPFLKARQTGFARVSGAGLGVLVWCLLVFGGGFWLRAQDAALPELRTAEEVRRLSPAEAERHYPVRLRGTVTFFDQRIPTAAFRFVQDETAGIYFYPQTAEENTNLATGQLVEIEGLTGQGEFAPVVEARSIKILGEGKFPAARPVSFEQLISGREDSQFVEMEGVVRSARFDERSKLFSIEIATGGGRLTAVAAQLPVKDKRGPDRQHDQGARGVLHAVQPAAAVVRHPAAGAPARGPAGGATGHRRTRLRSPRRRSGASCSSRRRAPTGTG